MSQLIVLRGAETGKTYTFEEKVTIGSTSLCNLVLSEKSTKDVELLIRKAQSGYFLNLTSGKNDFLFLNGTRLEKTQQIQHKDILQVGLTLILIRIAPQSQRKSLLKKRYRLNRILITELIGAYYEAYDQKIERPVMVYLIDPVWSRKKPSLTSPFLEMARNYAKLNHDVLPTLLDFGFEDECLFLVYEYVGQVTLRSLLTQKKPLPIPQVLSCIKEIAQLLRFASKHNLSHWNIHPDNILLYSGRTILLGLGFNKILIEQFPDPFTKAGLIAKLPYLSPEQCRKGDVTHLSDLFSLGVILFEMLTGQAPFADEDAYQLLLKIQKETYLSPSSFGIEVIPRLEKVLARLLEKNHNSRYAQLRDLVNDLEVCSLIFTYKDRFQDSFFSRTLNSVFFRWVLLPALTFAMLLGMWFAYLRNILEDI